MSNHMVLKHFLSILFPAAALVWCWHDVIRDRFYLTSLLLFLAGACQAYILAESGIRLYDGNFLWSAQLGLFIWFLASMRIVVQRMSADANRRWSPAAIMVTVLFSLHLASGMLWYYHETIGPGSFW